MLKLLPLVASCTVAATTGDTGDTVETDPVEAPVAISAVWLATALDRIAITGTGDGFCVIVVLVSPAEVGWPDAAVDLPQGWAVEWAAAAPSGCEPYGDPAPWSAAGLTGAVEWDTGEWPVSSLDVDLVATFEVEGPPASVVMRDPSVPLGQ